MSDERISVRRHANGIEVHLGPGEFTPSEIADAITSATDERIDRLAELARRVWPDVKVIAQDGAVVVTYVHSRDASHPQGQRLWIHHERALEMAEAALLAGLGDHNAWQQECVRMLDASCAARVRQGEAERRAEAAEARCKELETKLDRCEVRCAELGALLEERD